MKILVINDTMRIGGAEKFTVSLINEFLKKGNECAIFVIWSRHLESLYLLNKEAKVFLGKRRHKMDFFYLIKLKKIIKKFNPDVILCEAHLSYSSVKMVNFLSKIPVFFVLHYTYNFSLKDELSDKIFFFVFKLSSDRIIAIYKNQIKYFSSKYKISQKRFFLIPNGIDVTYFRRNEFGPRNNNLFNISHIANYREEKDQWTLLKALSIMDKSYKDWQLLFCGNIPLEIKDNFISFAKRENVDKKIIFQNYSDDVRGILEQADVFILSSISEALPVSALEAMAMEVPCILTNVGGCSDIIIDSINGFLVPPKKPDIIAEKILFLVKNPQKLEYMRKEARKTVVNNFNIESIAEKYLKLFEQVVK